MAADRNKKKSASFNNPFQAAKGELEKLVPKPVSPVAARAAKAPAPAPPPPPRRDEELFADEMTGVARLDPDRRGRINAPPPAPQPLRSRRAEDEAEAYAELADLIEGHGPFDFSDTDEYIEGLAPGLDKRLLKRLRKGDYALEGHVDLHGMTREEAYVAVEKFLEGARRAGKRCVLIIHGRGLHSKDSVPVLKERIKAWLERGRISQKVLAFASARQCDGGVGAVYVLLRR